MARIRTIKPDLWQSVQVMDLADPWARLLFIGLISQADDDGRGSADVRRLSAAIFPGDAHPLERIAEWLGQLQERRLVVLYKDPEHGALYELPRFRHHQVINKARKSHYPAPSKQNVQSNPTVAAHSVMAPAPVPECSGNTTDGLEGNGRERKGGERIGNGVPIRARDPEPRDEGGDLELLERIRTAYPAGVWPASDWLTAERELRRRLDEGADPAELVAGCERYAAQCVARDCGTRYVRSPKDFFSLPAARWREPYPLPTGGAPRRKTFADYFPTAGSDDDSDTPEPAAVPA